MSFRLIFSVVFLGQALLIFQTNGKPTDNFKAEPDWDTYPNLELGENFEGDIILRNESKDEMTGKAGFKDEKYRWKDNTVPYKIAAGFTSKEQDLINQGIQELASKTCIKFVQHTIQTDYIIYSPDSNGCSSYVGRVGGPQKVSLAPGCFNVGKGTVVHETIHALGFFHEHTRPDRDDYVVIHMDRIREDATNNFVKDTASDVSYFEVGYDYGSIMHYPASSFPKNNGDITISVRQEGKQIGQRTAMSDGDIKKVRNMYKC